MKKLILFFLIVFSATSFAQSRKGNLKINPGVDKYRLYVSFKQNLDGYDADAVAAVLPEFNNLAAEYGVTVRKAISISEQKLAEMEREAKQLSGSGASVAKLRNIVELIVSNPTNQKLLELGKIIENYDAVEYCSLVAAVPLKVPADIMPATALVEYMQGYISTDGVNMDVAWNMGLTGEGINIKDVEYGFNKNHEELKDVNAYIADGMEVSGEASLQYTEHGTAVLGIMYADKGDYGISGLAYGANEALLYPEWQPDAMGGYDRINAISQCFNSSAVGDIVVYEMQDFGAQGGFGPAEYNMLVWDLTKAATDAGVVVVAAAGNGNEDLDHPLYQQYMDRGDSGAIMVGAGMPDDSHNKLNFSTFGSRVNVQAWGSGVYSSGYGDVAMVGNDFNQAYTYFGGTSSATPIVASCAAVLQGQFHDLTGGYLTGPQLRDILVQTGTPQGSFPADHIGPIPNMQSAIPAVVLATQAFNPPDALVVYPNPVEDKLFVASQLLTANSNVEVYNVLGQMVHSQKLGAAQSVNFSSLTSGIYTVKVTESGKTFTRKIIRK